MNMSKKYKIGNVSFGCLDYIGKETNISNTENELRKLSIKQLNQLIKSIENSKKEI